MTAVEVEPYFPDRHKIHVAFDSFLSRSCSNIKKRKEIESGDQYSQKNHKNSKRS